MVIPKTQLAATVPKQGTPIKVEFVDDYPVPEPKREEVLVKVLYTGVCQSGQCLSNSLITLLPANFHVQICTQQLGQRLGQMASQ